MMWNMAFNQETSEAIRSYATSHLPDENWHRQFFSFVSNTALASRLGDEFLATRFVYKVLEGIAADSWLLRAQIRLQVLSYASIYEAVIHHVLFERLPDDPHVIQLTEFPMKKLISIPREKLEILEQHLSHDGKRIIPTYESIGKTDETKVRFDRKADCACELGFIEAWLRDELIEFYEARNSIHLHAEIRKSLDYQLDLSRRAFLRMEPFREQVAARLSAIRQ
jgi:hypothetical protein